MQALHHCLSHVFHVCTLHALLSVIEFHSTVINKSPHGNGVQSYRQWARNRVNKKAWSMCTDHASRRLQKMLCFFFFPSICSRDERQQSHQARNSSGNENVKFVWVQIWALFRFFLCFFALRRPFANDIFSSRKRKTIKGRVAGWEG